MPESRLAGKVQEMLNEEKWTRTALANYSVSSLKELDLLLEEARQENSVDEILALCTEHLSHTKNSVIALYLSGVIGLIHQQIDDSAMVQLIDIFTDNKRLNVVEFICQRMLDFGENRVALMRLADCYEGEEKAEQRFAVWERLVRIDYEEADIVKLLAERREKEGRRDEAIDFYKKALHRYINKGQTANVRDIWAKLVEFCPQDIDFFLHVQRKIAKQLSTDKAATLLMDLYRYYRDQKDWNAALDILRLVIGYDEKNPSLRKEIIDCYSGKYAGHSRLDDYIRLSNLGQSYRSLHEAMADFEKHIAFDAGNFVFNRTWNIGKIASVTADEVVVDFAKSRGHRMSLKMGIDSLVTLSRDHIWVLKAVWTKEKLHEKVKTDLVWALKTIIKSFDNKADLKRIKAELVPSVLSVSEWNSWSAKAREVLKVDSAFGNAADDISTFIVRDRPLSFEEKIYIQFKAEKNFFSRAQLMRDFLKNSGPDSEFFADMLAYFAGFLRSYQVANEYVVGSFLLLKKLSLDHAYLKQSISGTFADLFADIEDPVIIYENMKDAELRNAFVQDIKNFIPEWATIYIRILPSSRSMKMLDDLKNAGHSDKLKRFGMDMVENYRDHREAFIWLVKDLRSEPWFAELGIVYEKILITLIHILDITYKEIDNHRETTENRKINKQVQTILFKENVLEVFLMEAGTETVERVYALLGDVHELDPAIRMQLRRKIADKFPNFRFSGEEEKTIVSRGLMVTPEKYLEKQRLLAHIMEVEVPANQKEIAFALSLGDLRENAEYKAAKEKQDELNSRVAKLKNEIERAQLFDRNALNSSKVSFGTTVYLKNEISGEAETYTILGPWESDPDVNVISYLSPLGKKLYNHKPGDTLTFSIHDRNFQYRVEKIELANI